MPRVLLALMLLLPLATACHQPPPTPAPEAVDDVYAVLRRVTDFYQKTKTFQVDYSQEVSVAGASGTLQSQAKIFVERPNRFAMQSSSGGEGPDVVCDGEQVWMSMPSLDKYTQSQAPGSFDQLLVNAGPKGPRPLLEIFSQQAYERLMENVRRGDYIGTETIGDVEVDHLRFECQQFNWDAWVATGDQPRLLQARFELPSGTAKSGAQQLGSTNMISVQHYENWQFDAPLPSDAFVFEPPAGARQVDSFYNDGRRRAAVDRSPLVGHPAPDVELVLLNGRRLPLNDLKDEKIVVLDFWATWCEPCMRELPLVDKVADEYRDKDVVLYCVNQREDAETIIKFLAQQKLKATISLDLTGEIGTACGAQGLPTLVLIDKAGIVQAVHLGFSPDIGDKLKEEIDALLAGKSLAAEADDESNGRNFVERAP
jgi:peroxiredoxin